jgi:hypothetical protein
VFVRASCVFHGLAALVEAWASTYGLLVHVPIVVDPSPDGLRSTDPVFQRAVEELLARELDRRSLPVLTLHGIDRADWLDRVEHTVLDRLRPAQLPLL